jgi:hypothetical protein
MKSTWITRHAVEEFYPGKMRVSFCNARWLLVIRSIEGSPLVANDSE